MKVTIDSENRLIIFGEGPGARRIGLYSNEGFEAISALWIKVGWSLKYTYTFSWLGRPIIQLPEDLIRIQEVIYRVKPDVIIETGVAHGGSLIFYASLCRAMGRGRVIGIDIEIRPHNRRAIEDHELFPLIRLVEGSSTAPDVVARVNGMIQPGEQVIVLLDSNHSKQHVLEELSSYHHMVTPGSYLVATDGVMGDVCDAPRGRPEWSRDNPTTAAAEFAQQHPEFQLEQPPWLFNESGLSANVTHWPGAWLRRL